MALVLETFFNLESGTIHEFPQTKGGPTVGTTPAPPYSEETYVLDCNEEASTSREVTTETWAEGNNDYVIGFYVQFSNTSNPRPYRFARVQSDAEDNHFTLRVDAGGVLRVYDCSTGLVASSSAGVFSDDTWHLVEILFTFGNVGDIIIHVDGVEACTATGEDFDYGTGTTIQLNLKGTTFSAYPTSDVYFAGGYVYSGASSVSDFLGPFGSLTYQNRRATAVPDNGDDLDAGTWADAAEIPFNDSNYGKYTGSDQGIVTTHITDGGGTPGPYGDTRIVTGDEIKGAGWLFRVQHNLLTTGWCHYGDVVYSSPSTDGTSSVSMPSGNTVQNKLIVSEAAVDVPTTSEYFQYGFRGQALGAADARLHDCVCSLLLKLAVVGARGITLGSGYASRDRDILVG